MSQECRIIRDGAGQQIRVEVLDNSTGTLIATAIVPRYFSGTGAPSSTTLANISIYNVSDRYTDNSVPADYICTVAGSNATSQWKQISGGAPQSNDHERGLWTPAPTSPYMTYDKVVLQSGTATGYYISMIDDNTNAPDSGIGWMQLATNQGSWL